MSKRRNVGLNAKKPSPSARESATKDDSVPGTIDIVSSAFVAGYQRGPSGRATQSFASLATFLNVATFIVLCTYSALTAWQAYETASIARLTRQQIVQSQRPWVGTDLRETVITEITDGKPIEWHVDFKNYGNSPALHVKWHSRVFVNGGAPINWSVVQSEIEQLDLDRDMEFTIFNGQKLPNPGRGYKPAPIGLRDHLQEGTSQVILGGIVSYGDEFQGRHTTTFCIIYNPPKDGIPPGWIACPISPVAT